MTPHSVPPSGPLVGTRVVELSGLGPAPYCAMLLADYGAEVVRGDRIAKKAVAENGDPALYGFDRFDETELLNRGKRSIAVDLKNSDGLAVVAEMIDQADVLVEGFRPGVAE